MTRFRDDDFWATILTWAILVGAAGVTASYDNIAGYICLLLFLGIGGIILLYFGLDFMRCYFCQRKRQCPLYITMVRPIAWRHTDSDANWDNILKTIRRRQLTMFYIGPNSPGITPMTGGLPPVSGDETREQKMNEVK